MNEVPYGNCNGGCPFCVRGMVDLASDDKFLTFRVAGTLKPPAIYPRLCLWKRRSLGSWRCRIPQVLNRQLRQLSSPQYAQRRKWGRYVNTLRYSMSTDPDNLHETPSKRALAKGASELAEKAKEKTQNLAENVQEKVSDVGGRIRGAAENVQEKISDGMEGLRESANDLYDHASTRVRDAAQSGREYVQQYPFSTLLTAVAIGFICGYAARR